MIFLSFFSFGYLISNVSISAVLFLMKILMSFRKITIPHWTSH